MKILVACEFSGVVRDAFRRRGHFAVSCDLLPSEQPGPHIVGNVFDNLNAGWDMLIFFWPCTNMCSSGARWWNEKQDVQARDVEAFSQLATWSGIPKIAGENPIGVLSSKFRKPDQIIQPWQFGHGETKATCLWLKGLPKLEATNEVSGRVARVHHEPPGVNRWRNRSRTYQGIADAMAEQWSDIMEPELLPTAVKNSHALALDADRRDAYLERIAIWCEGQPETMEAHRVAWEQVTGERL